MATTETKETKENKLIELAHYLIPEKLVKNYETRLKAVVLLLTLLAIITISLLLIPVLVYSFNDSPIVMESGMKLIGVSMLLYILSMLILNRFAALYAAGNLALSGIYIGAVFSSWATGGIYSPLMYILLIPPVFSFVITNLKSATVWSILTIFTFIMMWGIDELAMKYESLERFESLQVIINTADITTLNIVIPLTSLITILTVVAIYEINSMQMKKMLSQERNMFAFKASHDPLTGLGNRAEFDTRLKMSIDAAWHSSYPVALVYIDLDGFKPINDTLGHHAGDVVLTTISGRLSKMVRGTDMVARLGGDEFAIILQGIGENNKIEPLLQKLLSSISEDIHLESGETVNVRGSFGVAYYPTDAETPDRLCRYADMAMYLAKEKKNTWRFYQDVIHSEQH